MPLWEEEELRGAGVLEEIKVRSRWGGDLLAGKPWEEIKTRGLWGQTVASGCKADTGEIGARKLKNLSLVTCSFIPYSSVFDLVHVYCFYGNSVK